MITAVTLQVYWAKYTRQNRRLTGVVGCGRKWWQVRAALEWEPYWVRGVRITSHRSPSCRLLRSMRSVAPPLPEISSFHLSTMTIVLRTSDSIPKHLPKISHPLQYHWFLQLALSLFCIEGRDKMLAQVTFIWLFRGGQQYWATVIPLPVYLPYPNLGRENCSLMPF